MAKKKFFFFFLQNMNTQFNYNTNWYFQLSPVHKKGSNKKNIIWHNTVHIKRFNNDLRIAFFIIGFFRNLLMDFFNQKILLTRSQITNWRHLLIQVNNFIIQIISPKNSITKIFLSSIFRNSKWALTSQCLQYM